MAIKTLVLPGGEELQFHFLRRWPNVGDMIYLQSIRSGLMNDTMDTALSYIAMAPHYAAQLASSITAAEQRYEAIVSPPSSRSDAAVYRSVAKDRTGARDLTDGFSRKGKVRAGNVISPAHMTEEFEYVPFGHEPEIKSLLIIDESVARGSTVAAVLLHLRAAGLASDCHVTVAAPVWFARDAGNNPAR